MSENMEEFRHIDGGFAVVERPFVRVVFQHGNPEEVGVNGCRVEDVIEIVIQKLLDFQGRDLACSENVDALEHLSAAQEALVRRRRRREQQGLIGSRKPHESPSDAVDPPVAHLAADLAQADRLNSRP